MTKLERIIISFGPISYFLKKSRKTILPGFEGLPLYDVLKFFAKQVKTQGLTERAAAISYNFVMAIPPTCIFLFTLIPRLPFIPQATIQAEIIRVINDIVPQRVHNEGLKKFVESFFSGDRIGLISFGFILSLYFASNAMMGLMRSFNRNYIGFQRRGTIKRRVVALKLTTIIFLLFLGCLMMLISQASVLSWLGIKDNFLKNLIVYGRWLIIFGLVFGAIGMIYRYAPALEKRWKFFNPGALLATLLSIISTMAFSVFVNNWSNYNALYDSIAILIVLMILIYINSLVILIGFEINVSIKSLKLMADQRKHEEQLEQASAAIT